MIRLLKMQGITRRLGGDPLDYLEVQKNPTNRGIPPEDLIQARFDSEYNVPPQELLIILSSQRSGSTLLCESLFAIDYCVAHEYFQEFQYLQILADRWPFVSNGCIDWAAFISHLERARTSPTGILGINAHGSHLPRFARALPYFSSSRRRCVIVNRDDLLNQALSLSEARQTRRWSIHFKASGDWQYDFEHAKACLDEIQLHNVKIQAFAAALGCQLERVRFEELGADPVAVLSRLTGIKEIEVSNKLARNRTTTLSKQSDGDRRKAAVGRFARDLMRQEPIPIRLNGREFEQ